MKITIRKAGSAAVLDLDGRLTFGDGQKDFSAQVQNLIDSGVTHAAINLARVSFIDSAGIGALVRSFTALKGAGGKCIFFAPSKDVRMLLRMVRLDSVFDLAEDEATALARIY